MDLCVVDWRAITPLVASGFAAFVALYISNKWNKQKGAEVIANEAKAYLIKLSELQSLQGDILKSIIESNGYDVNKSAIKEFKDKHDQLANSVVFLGFAINSVQFSDDSSTLFSQTIFFQKDVNDYLNNEKNVDQIRGIDPSLAYKLTEDLLKYALYEKTIKKRKNTFSKD